jgi:hypothetical protein
MNVSGTLFTRALTEWKYLMSMLILFVDNSQVIKHIMSTLILRLSIERYASNG